MTSSAGADAGDAILSSASEDASHASASGFLPEHPRNEALSRLNALDRHHLERMLRAERRYPGFLWASLGIAAALVIYYSWSGLWSAARAVLVVLILLGARAQLRQLRSTRLLRKLSGAGPEPW